MNINYFREFAVLAETQSYWVAAERLFIGQSSLSKHIKVLEAQLGAPLFARTSRRVELTEFGTVILPYAQAISKLQHDCEAAAFNYLHEEIETLRIAAIPAMAQYHITDTLLHFQLEYPSVQVLTQEEDSLVIRDRLIDQECELAFIRVGADYLEHDPERDTRLVKLPFCRDKLVAVLSKDHPLAKADHLELSQLKEETFALIKRGTMPYILCLQACQNAGFVPKVVFTSHHLDGILDMVTKGNCVALLFSNHVNYPIESVLSIAPPFAVVPILPEIETTICLAYLKDGPLSPAASHFVEHCMHTKAIDAK